MQFQLVRQSTQVCICVCSQPCESWYELPCDSRLASAFAASLFHWWCVGAVPRPHCSWKPNRVWIVSCPGNSIATGFCSPYQDGFRVIGFWSTVSGSSGEASTNVIFVERGLETRSSAVHLGFKVSIRMAQLTVFYGFIEWSHCKFSFNVTRIVFCSMALTRSIKPSA